MPDEKWPRKIKVGNSVVTVYRNKHPTYATGFRFRVWWTQAGEAHEEKRATEAEAITLAKQKASQLNAGHVEGASMRSADKEEFLAIRALCGAVPPLSAIREWRTAYDRTHGHILAAADAWVLKNGLRVKSITAEKAVAEFIAAKDRMGKKGSRTYGAKLKPFAEVFTGRAIDSIVAEELEQYLDRFKDGVTRNDFRKRAVALFRWAYKRRYLPQGAPLEIEQTERAPENPTEIGILTPQRWQEVLNWTRHQQPEMLAAVALAGFCGLRVEEIHGKRDEPIKRQIWDDVYLDRGYVRVTTAKTNTPSWRLVPLCPAAAEWLQLCEHKTGAICEHKALWKWRVLAMEAGLRLPENCLRHSFISYRIAELDGNKPQVASEAGNSVKEIDKRYRVPLLKIDGVAWANVRPV